MLNALKTHWKKTAAVAIAAASLVTGAAVTYSRYQVNTRADGDCCYPGSPCCYPGSPCCAQAHAAAARR